MGTDLGEKINLEKLLDNFPFEIWIKNTEGKYIYVNKFTIKNLGLPKKEIIVKTDFEIRKTEIANNCYLSDKEVLINNKCIYNEEVILNGDYYESFAVYKFPISLDNDEYLLGGCAKEISYKKSFQKDFNNLFMKSSFEEVI
ncbi:hypothetical protein [Clostridium perfringens]|uniref:hypothetical protein n=1 Tax=Clostridium perfringens TaxID=1502 RepID=UPI00112CB3F3|nr:hypothetical protein [Clostridium perfringens]TPF98043.1 hypothetical protein CBI46_16095 [Clostridium perfringens A]